MYSSKWKAGFFTGLITGIAIYALAKNPKGRRALSGLQFVSDAVKDEVGNMANRATDILDSTASIARNISRQETAQATGNVFTPGGAFNAGEAFDSGSVSNH